MYIDLVILIVGIVLVFMFFKRFSSFVFFIAIVDIFLRILTFIKDNIGLGDVSKLIGKYLPESIIDIIDTYTHTIPSLCIILKWAFVGIMCVFLFYIIKIFIKKKKI
jgi:hypothetical protein